MKKALFTLSLLAAAAFANAGDRTEAEMRAIAANKLLQTASVKSETGTMRHTGELKLVENQAAYNIYTPAEGQGFVIVAKSDLVNPVIGYSTLQFDQNDLPEGMRWYLNEVSRNIQAKEKYGQPTTRRKAATYTPVENFITTIWSQEYPFDRKTPNNYPAGCVATALAQCLNYYQYPASAQFEGRYYVTTTSGKNENTEPHTEPISTTYNWPYKDSYKSIGKYGDNIDELLRDCGFSTYMNYSKNGSGTSIYDAGVALIEIFQYPEECIKYSMYNYFNGQEEWNQTIYDELAQKSPVIYGASADNFGGHAFVFSGVDDEGLVYVNWGWRGSGNGFFAIDNLTPPYGNTNIDFSNNHNITYGIRTTPQTGDHIEGSIYAYDQNPYHFYWGIEKDENEQEHNTLFCNIPYGFLNMSPVDFRGVFGLFADDLTDGSSWVIAPELQDRDTIPAGYGHFSSSEQYKDFAYYYYIDGEKGLKPGHTYRMSFGIKDDYDVTWRSIKCVGGELAYEITYTGDIETSTISEMPTTRPLLTGIEHTSWNMTKTYSSDNVTRVYDLGGRIIYTTPTSQFNLWDIPAHGTFIVRQGQQSRKVVR